MTEKRDVTALTFDHEPATFRQAMSEAAWCLKGAWFHGTSPLRVLPLCRIGWHQWCACCSPVSCVRCGVTGHD